MYGGKRYEMKEYLEQYFFQKKTGKKLKRIIEALDFLTQEMNNMSMELDNLVLQVAETKTVEQSVVILLDGIKTQLDGVIAELEAAQVDTATLVQLRDDLDASELALAAAAATFTPPVVEPPVEPPVEP